MTHEQKIVNKSILLKACHAYAACKEGQLPHSESMVSDMQCVLHTQLSIPWCLGQSSSRSGMEGSVKYNSKRNSTHEHFQLDSVTLQSEQIIIHGHNILQYNYFIRHDSKERYTQNGKLAPAGIKPWTTSSPSQPPML